MGLLMRFCMLKILHVHRNSLLNRSYALNPIIIFIIAIIFD